MGEVLRPGSDAAVDHTGHQVPGHAHVHGHDLAPGRFGHLADTGPPGSKVFGHGAGHALVGLAHALRHHAVVGAEHQHGPVGKIKLGRAGQRGGFFQQRFQRTEAAQGFCEAGPVGVGGGAGRFVGRGDGGKKLIQFRFCHGFGSL